MTFFGCEIEMASVFLISRLWVKCTKRKERPNDGEEFLLSRQNREKERIARRKAEEIKIRKKYFPEAPPIPQLTPEMLARVEKAWRGPQGKVLAENGNHQCTGADLQTLVG